MTDHTPPTDQQLDEYEALVAAATEGPWGVYQYGGDSLIEIAADLEDTGSGYRARRTICRFDEEPLDNDPTHRDWTGGEDWAQVQADAKFIAAMSPEVAKVLVAEVRRLRAELAASRASALNAGADAIDDMERRNAWPVRPVDAGICSEFLRGMAAGSQPAGPDTLPAWLYQRFAVIHGCPPWDRATDRDHAYWEHQAAAVRHAVARGGFKTTEAAAVPAAVETGE